MLPLQFLTDLKISHDVVDIKISTLVSIALKCKDTIAAVQNILSLSKSSLAIQGLGARDKIKVVGILDLYDSIEREYTIVMNWADTASAENRESISVEEFAFLYQKLNKAFNDLNEIHEQRISTFIPSGATQFALIISENQIHQSSRLLLEQFTMPVFEAYRDKIMSSAERK